MEDQLGAPGTAGMSLDTDGAQWQMEFIDTGPPLVKLSILGRESSKGAMNYSGEKCGFL